MQQKKRTQYKLNEGFSVCVSLYDVCCKKKERSTNSKKENEHDQQ